MKHILKYFAIASSIGVSVVNADPIAYPGYTWGSLSYTPSGIDQVEDNNIMFQGVLNQGIDWMKINDNWTFNTYAQVSVNTDRNGLDYNNKIVPSVGAKLSKGYENGVVDFGVEMFHEQRFGDLYKSTNRTDTGIKVYANYWFGWDAKR